MRSRSSTLRSLALVLPIALGSAACSLLVENALSEKPTDPVDAGTGGAGGIGGAGSAGSETSMGTAGAPPCGNMCAASETCCAETCADLSTSTEHCGACGKACATGEICCDGMGCAECCGDADCLKDHVCQNKKCILQCTGVTVPCGDECADLTTSGKHCGACFNDCLAGHACSAGMCAPGWTSMATAGAPSSRQRAAAAWTGSRLFVWSGQNGAVALDDGALYDPSTNTWTPIDKPDPAMFPARVDASAVAIGDERVFVWGGGPSTDNSSYKSAAIYDAKADTWTIAATAPMGTRQAVAVWTGSRVLLWGGINGGSPFNGGAIFNPADPGQTTSWSGMAAANAPSSRTNVAGVWSGKELLIYGGRPSGTGATNEVYAFDPVAIPANAWRKLAGPPIAGRYDAFAVWAKNKMLVWGGRNDTNGTLDDGALLDLSGPTWTTMAPLTPQDRRSAPAGRSGWVGYTSTDQVLLAGGLDSAQQKPKIDGEVYDPAANVWLASLPGWPSTVYHEYGVGVWTGKELILWSGLHNGSLVSNGERYRP